MNIHFDDEVLFQNLKTCSISPITIGSHIYGLNDENSDLDYLYLYIDKSPTFLWGHHQLQYKEDDIDHNFSTIQGFIRNALTGDATINIEVIFSKEILMTELAFIANYKEDFVCYNIIKSYLGMAKRDLKIWKKDTFNGTKNIKENSKKLSHFVRGVIFAKMLLDGKFIPNMIGTCTIPSFINDLDVLKNIKSGMSMAYVDLMQHVENVMDTSRDELNKRLDQGKIRGFMNPIRMKNLDYEIKQYINSKNFDVELDYGIKFYDAIENGVVY